MTNMPETVIELYDDEQIHNVLATSDLKPKNTVFIGSPRLRSKKIRNNIISCIRCMGLDTQCHFRAVDMTDLEAVKAQIKMALDTFEGAAIDLTGGCETALVAVGMLASERKIPLFRYDRFAGAYRNVYAFDRADSIRSQPEFNIDAILALSGAVIKSHGHVSVDDLDGDTLEDIFAVWSVYKKNSRAWHRAVSYLQQISKDLSQNELSVSAKAVIYGGDRMLTEEKTVMRELADRGIIKNYSSDGSRVRFTYKSKLMRSCLIDIGICLELYVFAAVKTTGYYSDARISVVVDWDGKLDSAVNTINEIDVMVVSGYVPMFISCKSGTPNVTALNEVKTLAKQFGGVYARPVLVTMADVKKRDKYLAQRAADMGVELIDRADLVNEKLSKRLYSISKK